MTDTSPEPTTSDDLTERLAETVAGLFPQAVGDLGRLVRIPSVSWSAFDPEHVAASAAAVAELMRSTGLFETVEVAQAGIGDGSALGQPAVLARRPARDGRPTVLLYAHHDVQPPGREEDWETLPFEPTARGERLYGRGAADDKAGVMAHVAALRALAAVDPDPAVGLAVFIEGEEEFGSRSFATFLAEHRDELEADAIVVADSDNRDVDTPSLTVSLRGNVTFRLVVSTLEHASHSGMFGGAVPDAMLAAVRVLDSLWDEAGDVAVEGLTSHDAAVPDDDEAALVRDAALREGVTPIGTGPVLARMWSKPAITVTGIDAPSVAEASNTLLPSVAVRVSARIAPGQDARAAFDAIRRHLEAHAPFGAHLDFEDVDAGDPFLVDTSGELVAAMETAMTDGWGADPVRVGIGGSIPFVADLVRTFPDARILITGVEDPDTRAHSPNESLHLGVFRRAILTEALFLARLSR